VCTYLAVANVIFMYTFREENGRGLKTGLGSSSEIYLCLIKKLCNIRGYCFVELYNVVKIVTRVTSFEYILGSTLI